MYISELCAPLTAFQEAEKISDIDMVIILEELKQMYIRKEKMKEIMNKRAPENIG